MAGEDFFSQLRGPHGGVPRRRFRVPGRRPRGHGVHRRRWARDRRGNRRDRSGDGKTLTVSGPLAAAEERRRVRRRRRGRPKKHRPHVRVRVRHFALGGRGRARSRGRAHARPDPPVAPRALRRRAPRGGFRVVRGEVRVCEIDRDLPARLRGRRGRPRRARDRVRPRVHARGVIRRVRGRGPQAPRRRVLLRSRRAPGRVDQAEKRLRGVAEGLARPRPDRGVARERTQGQVVLAVPTRDVRRGDGDVPEPVPVHERLHGCVLRGEDGVLRRVSRRRARARGRSRRGSEDRSRHEEEAAQLRHARDAGRVVRPSARGLGNSRRGPDRLAETPRVRGEEARDARARPAVPEVHKGEGR